VARLSITSPLDKETIARLRVGDMVDITGVVHTARDAAHKRLAEALAKGQPLPFELKGQTIYYMGPSPSPPGRVIGACGPTTSGRMDLFTPAVLEAGAKALLGKGERSERVKAALVKHKAVYLVTYGGAGALLANAVTKAEVVAYPELGPEAVMRLEVTNLPAIVANDIYGGDLFEQEIPKWAGK
jgi:fumarate hydratase subunit beta